MSVSDVEPGARRVSSGWVMVFANAGHLYTHIFMLLYATAVLFLPTVFDVSYGELLGLSSVGLILFGLGAMPAGWLGDRWSKVGMLLIFFVGIGGATIVVGLAEDTATLFVGLSLLGLFGSIYHPVGIAWLVTCAKRQGLALGVNGVFGNVGSAIAPIFVGVMIDYVSWRAAFVIPGILSIVTGVAFALAWCRGVIGDVHADRAPTKAHEPGTFRQVFVLLTLTMACNGLVYTGLMNTVPKVFEAGLGVALAASYTEIGFYAGAVIGLSSVFSVLGGWLADRYSARTIYVIFWALTVPPLFFVSSSSGIVLLVVALLALSFNVTFAAAENMLVARHTPFRWRSLAYGFRFFLAFGVGGLTVRYAGQLYDTSGNFDVLYFVFAMTAMVAAVAAYFLPKRSAVQLTEEVIATR
jgi:FSR family fosmidomycin resistance protein-like MFS transporter